MFETLVEPVGGCHYNRGISITVAGIDVAAYFITGTGTDIGKTWLSAALLRHWQASGLRTQAWKPVMSGVDSTALEASDAGQLLLAQGMAVSEASVAEISPWQFQAALSPDMAARREAREIRFADLVAYTRRAASVYSRDPLGHTLVEGVGGVMVPLDDRHTVLDWIAAAGIPAILVCGSYLGSLSHTLTALLAMRSRGVATSAIVVNESLGASVVLDDAVTSLQRHVQGIAVHPVRRATALADVAALAHILNPSS